MIVKYDNIHISGIISAVPVNAEGNEGYLEILGEKRLKKQTRMTGVMQRRLCRKNQATMDLGISAAKELIKRLAIDDVKVLVLVTQSPSLVNPSTAFVIQKYLGLNKDCLVFDVNLGCSGYVAGLQIISSLLQPYGEGAKGILIAGDYQRNPHLKPPETEDEWADKILFGDCVSATAVEVHSGSAPSYYDEYSDGDRYRVISRKIGETDHMDGEAVFEFAIGDVSDMTRSFRDGMKDIGMPDPDYYVFHQAQKFMLKNVATVLDIEDEKMLFSLEKYGNTSSASVPLTICANKDLFNSRDETHFLLTGFGIGLSCAEGYVTLDKDCVLDVIEADEVYKV